MMMCRLLLPCQTFLDKYNFPPTYMGFKLLFPVISLFYFSQLSGSLLLNILFNLSYFRLIWTAIYRCTTTWSNPTPVISVDGNFTSSTTWSDTGNHRWTYIVRFYSTGYPVGSYIIPCLKLAPAPDTEFPGLP